MTCRCNSARRVKGAAAGGGRGGGAGEGVHIPFLRRSGFGFLYLAVSQAFHWYLISREKSCIVTQCYVIVQCSCVNKWLFNVPADIQTHVSKLLSASHW